MHALQILLLLAFPGLMILGALSDATSFTIPNRISAAVIGAFFLAALCMGMPLSAIGWHVAVGASALVLGMAMFALGWIGGGDAKLFAGAALWLGWPASLNFVLITGLAGGALALLLLNLRRDSVRPFLAGYGWTARQAEPGAAAPYGVAIAVGALFAFPDSPMMALFSGF